MRDKNKFKSIPAVVNKLFVLSYQRTSGERIQKHLSGGKFRNFEDGGSWVGSKNAGAATNNHNPKQLRPLSPTPRIENKTDEGLIKPRVLGMMAAIFLILLIIWLFFVAIYSINDAGIFIPYFDIYEIFK